MLSTHKTEYQKTLDFLFEQVPMYQKVGASAYKNNLNNILAIADILGNPQKKFKSIHIAGTNGKGSTSHMTAAVLQCAGYKVGLFTSPHLKDFRERIKINGVSISEQYVIDFVKNNSQLFKAIKPSFFELTTGLAFHYFAEQNVDIAVIEVGLGGRLDSTNIIKPLLSVITNISLDHTTILGKLISEIAFEKAGIIKPIIPLVIGQTQDETVDVFNEIALKNMSPIYFADMELEVRNMKVEYAEKPVFTCHLYRNSTLSIRNLKCSLVGYYQQKNIPTVIKILDLLKHNGFFTDENQVLEGLIDVVELTGLMGRWQVLGRNPLIICDTGHNSDGITEVVKQIGVTPYNKLHFVFGTLNDKNLDIILPLLPKDAYYYFCKPDIPRGLDVSVLKSLASNYHLQGNSYSSVTKALIAAKENALSKDLIFVGGSTFVVAEVIS